MFVFVGILAQKYRSCDKKAKCLLAKNRKIKPPPKREGGKNLKMGLSETVTEREEVGQSHVSFKASRDSPPLKFFNHMRCMLAIF